MSTFNPPLRAYFGEHRVMVLAEHMMPTGVVAFTVVYHEGDLKGQVALIAEDKIVFLPFFWSEIVPRYDMGDDPQDPEIKYLTMDSKLVRMAFDGDET